MAARGRWRRSAWRWATRAERRSTPTVDALGRPVDADWLLIDGGEAAFVEMATASGLARLAVEERTPANARDRLQPRDG